MIELVLSDKASKILKPADGSLDFPPFSVTTEFPAVLSRLFDAVVFVGGNQIDATFKKACSQWIAIGRCVINQFSRSSANHSTGEQRFDQSHFMWAGAGDHIADGQTLPVGQQHNLRSLAAFGFPYTKAPFLQNRTFRQQMIHRDRSGHDDQVD